MILKLFPAFALFLIVNLCYSQVSVSYLGQDLNKNIFLQDLGTDNNQTINIKKGQILINNRERGNDFIVAKNYEFLYNLNEPLEQRIIAFSINEQMFPDSGTTFSLSPYTTTDTTLLERINTIEEKKIYGDKAQVYLWKGSLDTTTSEIYNWKQEFIYDSSTEGFMALVGIVGTKEIDTLYKKDMKQGSYKVNVNKIGFGNVNGKLAYKIVDVNGARLITDPSRINKREVDLEIPFIADIPKLCFNTSLALYDADMNLVTTYFDKKLLKKGKFFERIKHNYTGYGDEQFIAILKNKKGETIHKSTVTFEKIEETRVKNRGTVSYLNMSLKYTSKKPEQRTKCTIENDAGEVLQEVYGNKNIHTGVNKVEYTFKHLLPEGQEVTLYVRNKAGKVIAKQSYTIR